MPRIIETVVCTIDELSDQAWEAARAWLRECGMDDDWDDFVLDDFATVCRTLAHEPAAAGTAAGGTSRPIPGQPVANAAAPGLILARCGRLG